MEMKKAVICDKCTTSLAKYKCDMCGCDLCDGCKNIQKPSFEDYKSIIIEICLCKNCRFNVINLLEGDYKDKDKKIGLEIMRLRDKLNMMKASNASYEECVRVAKGIIFAFEVYDKAKFGRKKTNLTIQGLLR